jgi:hypothetical protein
MKEALIYSVIIVISMKEREVIIIVLMKEREVIIIIMI